MTLSYDVFRNEFMVNDTLTLREFYIQCRRESGMTASRLQTECGIPHPTLVTIERPQAGRKPNGSIRAILIALEYLGYTIQIKKEGQSNGSQ